jgi:hypothetical protein
VRGGGYEVVSQTPIVTMRIVGVNGATAEQWAAANALPARYWALRCSTAPRIATVIATEKQEASGTAPPRWATGSSSP